MKVLLDEMPDCLWMNGQRVEIDEASVLFQIEGWDKRLVVRAQHGCEKSHKFFELVSACKNPNVMQRQEGRSLTNYLTSLGAGDRLG
jgi:hypothetical protein